MKKQSEHNLRVCKRFCKLAAKNVCMYGPNIKYYDAADDGWCVDHDPIVVTFLDRALEAYQNYYYLGVS